MSRVISAGVVLALNVAFGGVGALYILVHHGATIHAALGALVWGGLWASGTDKLLEAMKDARP